MAHIDIDFDSEIAEDGSIGWANFLITRDYGEPVPTSINVNGYEFAVVVDEGVTSGDKPVYTLGGLLIKEAE